MENAYMENPYFLELADQLKALYDQKKELEAELKQINAEIRATEKPLSDLMERTETTNFTHAGTTFYVRTHITASPLEGLQDDLYAAIRSEGHGDMIRETINSSTLSAFVKEQMDEETDKLPEWLSGLIKLSKHSTIGVRKAAR